MQQLHPLSAVSMALSRAMSGIFLPLAAVLLLSEYVDVVETSWLIVVVPLGLLAGLAYGVAYYYRFTYELTEDTFDVNSGVLSRQSREIPYRRIQNVDVRQKLFHRLLGVAIVSLETAGGGDTEATLNFVSEDEADRIQREVRRLTAAAEAAQKNSESTASTAPTAATTGETSRSDDTPTATASADAADNDSHPRNERTLLFELEFRELLLYAGTTVRGSAMFLSIMALAFLFGGDSNLQPGFVDDLSAFAGFGLGFALWVVAMAVLSAAFTIGRYYGFRLERTGNDFVYERGLIERYSGSIPVDKVQSVSIMDNPLQRLFGYAGLSVETAGYGPESESGSESTVPFAAEDRVYRFAEEITGVERPAFSGLPKIARRRYLGRYTILATLIVAAAFVVSLGSGLERWYLAAIIYAAVPPAAHLKWSHMAYYAGDEHLVVRRGFWRRQTTVIPYYRIQTLTTRRSLFQRRLGLATVVVDTASSGTFTGAPKIVDVELEDGREVHEDSRKRLQQALRERARDGEQTPAVGAA